MSALPAGPAAAPLDEAELSQALAAGLSLASWAMTQIRQSVPGPQQMSTKDNPADWVTSVDRDVERHVRAELLRLFPTHQIQGEEHGASPVSERGAVWFCDPIDGTTNYVHRLPWSSFSLGLMDSAGTAVGVVADPWRREVFSAVRGRGAWLEGEATRVVDARSLMGRIALTEMRGVEPWLGMNEMIASLSRAGCVTRIMGSSALSLASIAAGRCVATVLEGYNAWDAIAGALIARESGAVVLSRAGERVDFPAGALLAACPGVADAAWAAWTGSPQAP